MAVTQTNKLFAASATDATSYNTASVTPTANRLYLLAVWSRTGITADPNAPTVTGAGLTWVQVATVVYDNTSSSRRRLTVFRAMGAGSAGALTIDFGGQTQTSATWDLTEFDGVDTSGTNGSGAVVQSATNFDGGTTATSITATLSAFGSVNNATYGAGGSGQTGNTAAVGSGFTQISNGSPDGEAGQLCITEFKNSNDTTVDASFTPTGSEIGIIGVEIKAAAAAVINPSFFQLA